MFTIAKIISTQFPQLLEFTEELGNVEAAMMGWIKFLEHHFAIIILLFVFLLVDMEAQITAVKDIEKKLNQASNELQLYNKGCEPALLKKFVEDARPKLCELQDVLKLTNKTFEECLKYCGETPGKILPSTFFSKIIEFSTNFRKAKNSN